MFFSLSCSEVYTQINVSICYGGNRLVVHSTSWHWPFYFFSNPFDRKFIHRYPFKWVWCLIKWPNKAQVPYTSFDILCLLTNVTVLSILCEPFDTILSHTHTLYLYVHKFICGRHLFDIVPFLNRHLFAERSFDKFILLSIS